MRFAPCVVLAAATACGSSSAPAKPDAGAPSDGFDRNAMLAHLAADVLLPAQTGFASVAAQVPPAISAYCDALAQGAPGTTLETARTAWAAAIDAWEANEIMLVGPAAMTNKALRDKIYSWPLVATCNLDRDTASSFADPASYDPATKLVNARSLSAIEYLLFTTDLNYSCPTAPTGWAALGDKVPLARCRQALAIASDVATNAAQLAIAWRADGGNYVAQLSLAGQSGSSLTSAQDAINRVSDAMFYVDSMTKDMKVGESAGIAVNACGTVGTPCEREVELRYADRGSFAIRINLRALRAVFTGDTPAGTGVGFDDFLTTLGHGDVATRMVGKLDAAIAAADALPDSFLTALTANYEQVAATYHAIDMFTDDLKSQFLTLLALEIPDDVATDND